MRDLPHLSVTRLGNTVVARTELGRGERVVLAGHIDTVPLTADPVNLPTRRVTSAGGEVLWGRGTVDMKGGVAVMLRVAHEVPEPSRDVTFVFYEAEEIDSKYNGLLHVEEQRPELIADADFAVLLEPTDARVEGGCKGTLRAEVSTKGIAAHSARPWKGHNAIHDAGEVLARLVAYEPVTRVVDGLEFREALNAVLISGGVATNVIPDRCVVTVNYRYAPSLSEDDAEAHVRQVFSGFDVDVVDNAGGARPGLHLPAAKAFVEALGPAGRGQAGLDRRRALLGDRGARRQLRPRRPEPGPHGRRAVPGRAVRRLRGRAAPLARLTPGAPSPGSRGPGIQWRRGPDPEPEAARRP